MGSHNGLKIHAAAENRKLVLLANPHCFLECMEGMLVGLPLSRPVFALSLRSCCLLTGAHAIEQWLVLWNGCLVGQTWNSHIVNGEMTDGHIGFLFLFDLLAPPEWHQWASWMVKIVIWLPWLNPPMFIKTIMALVTFSALMWTVLPNGTNFNWCFLETLTLVYNRAGFMVTATWSAVTWLVSMALCKAMATFSFWNSIKNMWWFGGKAAST